MRRSLWSTWALLLLAVAVVSPIAWVASRSFVAEVFPQCRGTLEQDNRRGSALPPASDELDATGSPHRGGYVLRIVDDAPPSSTARDLQVERVETDADGAELSCGRLPLSWPGGADRVYPAIYEHPGSGLFEVRERYARFTFVTFRATSIPTRRLQLGRLSPRHLPALVALLGLAALALALVRSRRGIAYATTLHAWQEAELHDGGRVVGPHGGILGVVVVEAVARVSLGRAVLVAPDPEKDGGPYRDLRILRRADVASGSHAWWRDVMARSLADARALALVSTACSVCASVARWIG